MPRRCISPNVCSSHRTSSSVATSLTRAPYYVITCHIVTSPCRAPTPTVRTDAAPSPQPRPSTLRWKVPIAKSSVTHLTADRPIVAWRATHVVTADTQQRPTLATNFDWGLAGSPAHQLQTWPPVTPTASQHAGASRCGTNAPGWASRLGDRRGAHMRRALPNLRCRGLWPRLNQRCGTLEIPASVWISSHRADACLDRIAAGKYVGSGKRR